MGFCFMYFCYIVSKIYFSYPCLLFLVPGEPASLLWYYKVDLLLDMSWNGMREGWSHWKHVGFHTVAFFISDPVEVGSATIIQDVAVGALHVGGTSTIGGTYGINSNAILGLEVVVEVGTIFEGLTAKDGNGFFFIKWQFGTGAQDNQAGKYKDLHVGDVLVGMQVPC